MEAEAQETGAEGMIRTFRDLVAWQRGMEVAKQIYVCTRELPGDERFGLTAQMRRAAVSIPSNIAEGYARQSRIDYLRYLRTARGSLAELQTQLELCRELELLHVPGELNDLLEEADRVLQGLIRSLERSAPRKDG